MNRSAELPALDMSLGYSCVVFALCAAAAAQNANKHRKVPALYMSGRPMNIFATHLYVYICIYEYLLGMAGRLVGTWTDGNMDQRWDGNGHQANILFY